MSGKLLVADGWRKTVLDWRMSVAEGVVGGHPGFFPLPIKGARRLQWNVTPERMAIEPYMGPNPKGPAYDAGIRGNHVVTAVNGESPNLAGRAFLVWFTLRFEPGEVVTLTVMDGPSSARDITYRLPSRGAN